MRKLINRKTHSKHPLTIKSYTKAAFHRKEWNEETINARGHVHDDSGELVSCPFPKIFNIGETPDTQMDRVVDLMARHAHEVTLHDKYNGHLGILFNYEGEWINTTKGSFDHEFIAPDRSCIEEAGFTDEVLDALPEEWTLLFEIIGDHDPHLMTPHHQTELGMDDTAVLLGIYDRTTQKPVPNWEQAIVDATDGLILGPIVAGGKPLTDIFPVLPPNESDRIAVIEDFVEALYEETHREGYVIHIPSIDFRVKVKTSWFLRARYASQFDQTKTKKIFLRHRGSDEAFEMIPEELHDSYRRVLADYAEWTEAMKAALMDYMETLNGIGIHDRRNISQYLNQPDLFDTDEEYRATRDFILHGNRYEKSFSRLFVLLYDGFSLIQSDTHNKEDTSCSLS